MSETMTPVPSDSPLMVAWNAYKQTPEYANTLKWATRPDHAEGSLWAAFEAGFAHPRPDAASASVTEAMRDQIIERAGLDPNARDTDSADPVDHVVAGIRAALAAAPRDAGREEAELLRMLENGAWQIDTDDDEWVVHIIHGPINDRQWHEAGRGFTWMDALRAARRGATG